MILCPGKKPQYGNYKISNAFLGIISTIEDTEIIQLIFDFMTSINLNKQV